MECIHPELLVDAFGLAVTEIIYEQRTSKMIQQKTGSGERQ